MLTAKSPLRTSSREAETADVVQVIRPSSLLRRPGALIITTLAATDLAYRLLLREPVRRVLGIGK
jgi:hypothetical protein